MSTRPKLLDLYCCSGGAAVGYDRAGFEVTGVDINPQPDYPFEFIQGDAIAFVREHGHEYDAWHASPPCQFHTTLTKGHKHREVPVDNGHINLIPGTRAAMLESDLAHGRWTPSVLENVVGAKSEMRTDLTLCGLTFGLRVFRHRLFELEGFTVPQPEHISHKGHRVSGWRHGVKYEGDIVAVYGNGGGKGDIPLWQEALGMTHTTHRKSLAEAIPPAYTEHIGTHLIRQLTDATR